MDARGKKHICPFCNAMFYDMSKAVVVCPKCDKSLSKSEELEFIKQKKKTENKLKTNDKVVESFNVDENIDSSESEMFFDVEDEYSLSRSSYKKNEEDY